MKKTIFKSIISSFVFVVGVLVFGFLVLKVMAGITNVSSGSSLTADMWNDMVSQVFQKNGNNLYYITGNVGIGTNNPTAPLYISGYTITKYGNGTLTIGGGGQSGSEHWQIASTNNGLSFNNVTRSANRVNISLDGKVGIGTSNPSEKLDVNGTIKANSFLSNTSWSLVPTSGNRTSSLYCRKIGSTLQIRGYITYSTTFTYIWGPILTLPSECRPEIDVNYISVSCWYGSNLKAGLAHIGSNGVINLYYSDVTTQQCAFAGNYPAN